MLKLSLNMLKLFKQTAGETLGTAGLTISIFSTCASPRWEACIQSYLKHKSLSLHELARAWAKRMQRGALQVQGICRMRLSSFATHIWAISETGDSRKGHQQIWQGPIAYQRENNVCAHVQHNLQRAHCYLGRSRRLPFTKFVS